MHLVTLQDLRPVLNPINCSADPKVRLSQEDVRQSLQQLFLNISKELSGQEVLEATDQTTRLLFKLFDREQTGAILLRSVEVALIALSGDSLSAKQRGLLTTYTKRHTVVSLFLTFRMWNFLIVGTNILWAEHFIHGLVVCACVFPALFRLTESYIGKHNNVSGTISQTGLRILLKDLSQVPAVVQENHVFGAVETAVASCFKGVVGASVTEEHFIGWLQSEPCLLLWLSTLYRLSMSETVQHRVRCHACKAFPIIGLRYRCLKCLNTHLCQNCFLTERRSRKHKPSHPVLEYCTQPSWRESVASLASSARHALLPRHRTRRDAERTQRALRADSSAELQYIPSPSVHRSVVVNDTQETSGSDTDLTASTPVLTVESKCLQTEDTETAQKETAILQKDLSVTQKAMKDMQRDKWLLEKEFQVWRVAAQSEHDSLEDKCTELKTMMEALSQHNHHLEEELERVSQVLSLRNNNELRIDLHSRSNQDDDCISEKDWTPPECLKPHESSSEEVAEESNGHREQIRGLESKEVEQETVYGASEDICTNLYETDSILVQEQQGTEDEGEWLKEKEEEQLYGQQDLSAHQPSVYAFAVEDPFSSDDTEMEEELCKLVQRLRNELSSCTPKGSGCMEREMLMMAAEGIKDSVSHLVTSVSTSLG
ncbi:dystrotelin isoform X1 [Misgurnus anguillicaudatus]|uniref:dystrotelin isoform X1 n=1 Tax=Misgurnus anguillicaudatus TaxID=75329 RepID=UPI003CCFC448